MFRPTVQDELAKQLSQRHLETQLQEVGDRLKAAVKVEEEEDTEEDMDELGWGENVEGDNEMEEVEVEEERRDPFYNTWTKRDMEAVRAAAVEEKKKEAEVVDIAGDDEEEEEREEDDDRKGRRNLGVKGGGKDGGKKGGKRVLAPWAKQKKEQQTRDWVVKVDEWGGKRFNSGWYHYNNKWYPILVLYKGMFFVCCWANCVSLQCSSHGFPCNVS